MTWRSFLGLVLLAALASCTAQTRLAGLPVESIAVPERASTYLTSAQPDGVVGGQGLEQVQADIVQGLAQRGQQATADGALSATASWALSELYAQRHIDQVGIEAASRHFGFAGVVTMFFAFDTQNPETWREPLERLPSNMRLNRYGIRVSPSGRSAAVVLGAVEIEYEPIARDYQPGQVVALHGRVGSRFSFAHVYLTKPDGSVAESNTTGRDVNVSFNLDKAGQYQLEVMGDGPTGPVILSNVPLYVGVPERTVSSSAGSVVEPEQAEARMLVLLNQARQSAGLAPLVPDEELRQIALGHTEDMIDHRFFSHVSPTTGRPEDRARKAGILVSIFGENIALAATPESAHEGLMGSPGHRANMLRPEFTHVGIAAGKNASGLVVTLAFGRRPSAAALPSNAAQVQDAFVALRAAQGLAPVPADPIYRAGAQAGADVLAEGADEAEFGAAVEKAVKREVQRLRSSRPGACLLHADLLELAQLKELPVLVSPALRRFGIGARVRRDAKGARLSTVFMLEGISCQ